MVRWCDASLWRRGLGCWSHRAGRCCGCQANHLASAKVKTGTLELGAVTLWYNPHQPAKIHAGTWLSSWAQSIWIWSVENSHLSRVCLRGSNRRGKFRIVQNQVMQQEWLIRWKSFEPRGFTDADFLLQVLASRTLPGFQSSNMVPKCPKDESVSRKLASGMRTAHQVSFLCHFFIYFFCKDFTGLLFWYILVVCWRRWTPISTARVYGTCKGEYARLNAEMTIKAPDVNWVLFGKQIWSSVKPDLLCPSLYRSKKSGTPSTLANWKVTPWYRDLSCISRWLNLYVRDMQRHAQTILLEELVVWCLNKPNELPFLWDSSHAKACSKNSLEELVVWCLNKPHKLPFLRDTWHAKACRSRISSWIIRGINPRNPVISFDFMWFQHLLLGTYDTYAFRGGQRGQWSWTEACNFRIL